MPANSRWDLIRRLRVKLICTKCSNFRCLQGRTLFRATRQVWHNKQNTEKRKNYKVAVCKMRRGEGSIFSVVRRKKLWRYTRTTTYTLITLSDECLSLDLLMKVPFACLGIEFHSCTDLSGTSHNFTGKKPFQIFGAIDKIRETARKHDMAWQKGIQIKANVLVLTITDSQICISN